MQLININTYKISLCYGRVYLIGISDTVVAEGLQVSEVMRH